MSDLVLFPVPFLTPGFNETFHEIAASPPRSDSNVTSLSSFPELASTLPPPDTRFA